MGIVHVSILTALDVQSMICLLTHLFSQTQRMSLLMEMRLSNPGVLVLTLTTLTAGRKQL